MVIRGYKGLTLPEDLVAQIDAYVDSNKDGYRTRAEVVAAAVRDFLERRRASQILVRTEGGGTTTLLEALHVLAQRHGVDELRLLETAVAQAAAQDKPKRAPHIKPRT